MSVTVTFSVENIVGGVAFGIWFLGFILSADIATDQVRMEQGVRMKASAIVFPFVVILAPLTILYLAVYGLGVLVGVWG